VNQAGLKPIGNHKQGRGSHGGEEKEGDNQLPLEAKVL
jgi:hypothetical protein